MERPEDQEGQPGHEAARPGHHPGVPQRPLGRHCTFTNYLSRISPPGKTESATRPSVGFRAGVGGKENSGVTSTVTKTPRAIGYISASYLIAAGLRAAAIQNKAGNYELPNLKNIESAAAAVKSVPASNELNISNPPKKAKTAYPISTFTYAIIPHNAPQKGFLQQFLNYAITKGQAYGAALDFAPLPKVVSSAAKKAIASL